MANGDLWVNGLWWGVLCVSLTVMGVFWCFHNRSGFFLPSKQSTEVVALKSVGLCAFYPCFYFAVESLHSTFVPGLPVTVFPVHVWLFFVFFFFSTLDLQIHQVQWYAAVWQLSPRTLLCLCTRRTYVGCFSHLSWIFELWRASGQNR